MSRRTLKLLPICGAVLLLTLPFPATLGANEASQVGQQSPLPSEPKNTTASRPAETTAHPQPKLKELPPRIIRDQGFFWLRPFRMRRSDLPCVGVMVGTTAGLIAIDRRVGQGLSDSPPGRGYTFSRYVGRLGAPWTDLGMAGTIYLVGRWRDDEHAQTTGLLGLQAVADSVLLVEVIKNATQRPRPTFTGGYVRNHNADGEFFAGGRSFPSGHAAGAFALATVVSERNRERRWVPPLAYGFASLVSVSRITQRSHFPSDVFVGAVLGFLIGRHVAHEAQQPTPDKPRRSRLLPSVSPAGGAAVTVSWEF